MQTDQLETAFSKFLDGTECDQAENALFLIIREAFIAGWKSAYQQMHSAREINLVQKRAQVGEQKLHILEQCKEER